jgi:hypothetical protein
LIVFKIKKKNHNFILEKREKKQKKQNVT